MLEAHNITKLEGGSLENAIKDDFGLDIKNPEKITKGYASQVYKASLEDKEIFVRINKDHKVFEAEILGYSIFEKQEIPVPKIIAYKENPKTIGIPTMIMSSAQGKIIHESDVSLEQQDVIFEHLGEVLKKINENRVEGFGALRSINGKLIGKFPTYKEYCEFQKGHTEKTLSFSIENNYITNKEAEKIRKVCQVVRSHLLFLKRDFLRSPTYSYTSTPITIKDIWSNIPIDGQLASQEIETIFLNPCLFQ